MVQEVKADARARMGFKDKMGWGVLHVAPTILSMGEGLPLPSLFAAFLKAMLSTSRDGPVLLCIRVHLCTILMPLDILPVPQPR